MRTTFTAILAGMALAAVAQAPLARAQGINAPLAQPSPTIATGSASPVVTTPRGAEVGVGGSRSYEQLSGPGGGGITTSNSNGTSTINNADSSTRAVSTPR